MHIRERERNKAFTKISLLLHLYVVYPGQNVHFGKEKTYQHTIICLKATCRKFEEARDAMTLTFSYPPLISSSSNGTSSFIEAVT